MVRAQMMQSGTQTLSSIDKAIQLIHDQLQKIDVQNRQESTRLIELEQARAQQYKRIAKIRLNSVIHGELKAGLDTVDQRVQTLLQERNQALEALNSKIDDIKKWQKTTEQRRMDADSNMVDASRILDEKEAATQQALEQKKSYQAQLAKTKEADRIAKHAEEKNYQAEEARQQKGEAYEQDALFMYLWKRQYGTKGYQANVLTRFLDGAVARLCGFIKARPNYAMLLEIPKRLSAHAMRVRDMADEEFARLTQMEIEAAVKNGIPELKDKLTKAQARLDAVDKEVEKAEQELQAQEQQRDLFSSGEDSFFQRAIDAFAGVFEQESLQQLSEYAKATSSVEDDRLVDDIGSLKRAAQRIKESLRESKRMREHQLDRLQELEGIRRRFKEKRYDSSHSGFSNANLIAMILEQFLQGTITSGDVWRSIERGQGYRKIEANPDFGSGGFRGRKGTWNIPFPREREIGSSDGGGFRTGGGF